MNLMFLILEKELERSGDPKEILSSHSTSCMPVTVQTQVNHLLNPLLVNVILSYLILPVIPERCMQLFSQLMIK